MSTTDGLTSIGLIVLALDALQARIQLSNRTGIHGPTAYDRDQVVTLRFLNSMSPTELNARVALNDALQALQ